MNIKQKIKDLYLKGASLYEMEQKTGLSPEELVKEILGFLREEKIPKRFTYEDFFIYLWERGVKDKEKLKDILGISESQYWSVRYRVRKLRNYKLPRETKEERFFNLLRENKSLKEIKEILGFSDDAFAQFIKRLKAKGYRVRRISKPQYVLEFEGKVFVSDLPPLKKCSE